MSIASRVKTAFDFIRLNDYENALIFISIVVDATSKKIRRVEQVSQKEIKISLILIKTLFTVLAQVGLYQLEKMEIIFTHRDHLEKRCTKLFAVGCYMMEYFHRIL
jgi:hypothetical protein